jgi:hypothetical protein
MTPAPKINGFLALRGANRIDMSISQQSAVPQGLDPATAGDRIVTLRLDFTRNDAYFSVRRMKRL